MKTLKKYITEKANFLIKKHIKNKNVVEYINPDKVNVYNTNYPGVVHTPGNYICVVYYGKHPGDITRIFYDIKQLNDFDINMKNHMKLFIEKFKSYQNRKCEYDELAKIKLEYVGDVLGEWKRSEHSSSGWSTNDDYVIPKGNHTKDFETFINNIN